MLYVDLDHITKIPYPGIAGVSSGSILSRVTIEVDVVGSNPARDSLLQIDRPKMREREFATFDAERRE